MRYLASVFVSAAFGATLLCAVERASALVPQPPTVVEQAPAFSGATVDQVRFWRRFRGHGGGFGGGAGLGLGIGLGIVGGAILSGALNDGYYDDGYDSGAGIGSCSQRFRSYDPYSQTYLGYDGRRHHCG